MPNIHIEDIRDFTGGLNLLADAFQLAPNESPDMLNVDVDPRGGFRLRSGTAQYGGDTAAQVESLHAYDTTTGGSDLLLTDGTNLRIKNGGLWDILHALTGTVRSFTFKDKIYFHNGSSTERYDGSTVDNLADPAVANDWNDDITSPTDPAVADGFMPIAKCSAVHRGVAFVANTTENGTNYPNRVRWSHPNYPEDWFSYHFIDIDEGVDGDYITALMPYGDHLLVFKNNSIHGIFGDPPESFVVYPITREVGAISQEAVVASDMGVFFANWPEGVFQYRGKGVDWVFETLYPMITEGDVPDAYSDQIQLGWGNQRLWVSVPLGTSATTRTHSFVLDPRLGKNGSWVKYDLAVGPFLEWTPPGDDATFLAGVQGDTCVLQLDLVETETDGGSGASTAHIDSFYRTRWVDQGNPGVRKRWKRPSMVMRAGTETEITVDAFRNYNASVPIRHFSLITVADSSALVWDVGNWDATSWGRDPGNRNEIEKGSAMGNGESVSLKFNGPVTDVDWGVDAISFKYITRKVRS